MPEELGNLIIRISSVGFDEVYQQLERLEGVMSRLGSNSSLDKVSRQLDQMSRYMKDMHGDLAELTLQHEKNTVATTRGAEHAQIAAGKYGGLEKTFKAVSIVAGAFWAAASVPRKFIRSIEQVSAFNLSLTNMSINANVARGTLMTLGAAVEGLGGSKAGLAGTLSGFQASMQGLRMGRGGGGVEEASVLYGLDIRGTSRSGLATPDELLRNVAKLFEKMGDSAAAQADKLDIKRLLGLDDGTFKFANQGVKRFDAEIAKAAEETKKMASAVDASNRVSELRAQKDKEWANAELKMAEAAEPVTKWLQEQSKGLAEQIQNHAKLSAGIKYAVGGLWELGKVAGSVYAAFAAFKFAKNIGSIAGALSSGAGFGGGIAGGIPRGIGGAAGSVGRAAGSAAIGAAGAAGSIGGAIVNALQGGTIMNDTLRLVNIVSAWRQDWKSFSVYMMAKGGAFSANSDYMAAVQGALQIGDSSGIQNILLRAAYNARRMDSNIGSLPVSRNGQVYGSSGNGVSISNIEITVNSNATDAEEVAKAVREELFKQINQSIEDAVNGSKML